MSQFVTKLFLRALSPDEIKAAGLVVALYEVTQDFIYASEKLGRAVIVKAGLITDFASTPREVWALISPEDPVILYPSVVHDYLYSCQGALPDGFTYTREQADAVLREAMEVCGASSVMRNLVYDAVEQFGGSHWKS